MNWKVSIYKAVQNPYIYIYNILFDICIVTEYLDIMYVLYAAYVYVHHHITYTPHKNKSQFCALHVVKEKHFQAINLNFIEKVQ